MPSNTPLQEFYAGAHVLVTGATGFFGRLLVEKLVRTCPVHTVYVLVREKKSVDMGARLHDLFDGVVFDRLRAEQPDFQRRIVGIYGDCAQRHLGIADDDRATLEANVEFVFHCAATVRFDEALRTATLTNVRATRDLLQMAHSMRRLRLCVHVSTAYAHCLPTIGEEFYPTTYTPQQLIALAEVLPERVLEQIQSTIVGEFPNTYVFTKTVAEQLLTECDVPVAMYRPAIMVSTYREPVPGWINNYYGPQGVTAGAMVGLLRTLHCDEDVHANIVPVDMCVNGLLAAARDARRLYDDDAHTAHAPQVYHFESNSTNPIRWRDFLTLAQFHGKQCCSVKMIGIYFFQMRRNYYANLLAIVLLHYLPAIIFDLVLVCARQKPRMIRAYKKVHKFSAAISYFCTKTWRFESANYARMCDAMCAEDALLFFCDLRKLDWNEFFRTYLLGCRLYLIKDPLDTIPDGHRHHKKMTRMAGCAMIVWIGLLATFTYYLFGS